MRMQLFPLEPLIDFFLLRLGMHIDVYIPGSVKVLKLLKLVLLSQCYFFIIYQHNNTSKEREEKNDIFFNNVSFYFHFHRSYLFSRFLTFDVVHFVSPKFFFNEFIFLDC